MSRRLSQKQVCEIQKKLRLDMVLNDIKCPNCGARLTKKTIYHRDEGYLDSDLFINKKNNIRFKKGHFQTYNSDVNSGFYCRACNEQITWRFVNNYDWYDSEEGAEKTERLKLILRRNE